MGNVQDPDAWYDKWKIDNEIPTESPNLDKFFQDYKDKALFIGIDKLPFDQPGSYTSKFSSEIYQLEYDANMVLVCSVQISEIQIEMQKGMKVGNFNKVQNSSWRLMADSLAISYIFKINDIVRRLEWLSGQETDSANPPSLNKSTRDKIKEILEQINSNIEGLRKVRNSLAHNIGRSSGVVRDGRSRLGGIRISNWNGAKFGCSDERGTPYSIDTSLVTSTVIVKAVVETRKILIDNNLPD